MNGFSSSARCPIGPAHDLILRLAAKLELRSEQVPLTLGELSDRLDLADSLARQELAALGAAPPPLASQQLSHRPRARLQRAIKDHLSRGEASSTDPSLELRAGTPDLVRPLQRQQPMWLWTGRCSSHHVCLQDSCAPSAHRFAIRNHRRPRHRMRPRAPGYAPSHTDGSAPRVTVAGALEDRPSGSEGYAAARRNGKITLAHPHAPSALFASTGGQRQSDRALVDLTATDTSRQTVSVWRAARAPSPMSGRARETKPRRRLGET